MKGEYFATFMHDVNNNVKELTKSSISQDVLAGILSLSSSVRLSPEISIVLYFYHAKLASNTTFRP
jgi:hypothetical protein